MAPTKQKLEKALVRCTRYAFMPNRLHLCGPENQADILEFYAKTDVVQPSKSIEPLLKKFETLYPYLKLIARANQQKNPLDEKIVEAYWLGNEMLEQVPAGMLFDHLNYAVALKKRLGPKKYNIFLKKFNKQVLPHHNFHVLSLAKRTGHVHERHTLATMDACRISWGIVKKVAADFLIVETKPLQFEKNDKIIESDFIEKKILNRIEGVPLLKDIKVGDLVSLHWSSVCERLNQRQLANLRKYTQMSLIFANLNS